MSNVYHILTMATTQSNLLVFVHNVSRQQIYTHKQLAGYITTCRLLMLFTYLCQPINKFKETYT